MSCQVTRKFIRCRNAEIPTISAIKYTACYRLVYFRLSLQTIVNIEVSCHCYIALLSVSACVFAFIIFFKGSGNFLKQFYFRVGFASSFKSFGLVRFAGAAFKCACKLGKAFLSFKLSKYSLYLFSVSSIKSANVLILK